MMIQAVSQAFVRSTPRRFASTQAHLKLKTNSQSFSKNWLSDPSTYPVILCLGGAVALCAGFGFNFLRTSKDVRIVGDKKHSVIRTW